MLNARACILACMISVHLPLHLNPHSLQHLPSTMADRIRPIQPDHIRFHGELSEPFSNYQKWSVNFSEQWFSSKRNLPMETIRQPFEVSKFTILLNFRNWSDSPLNSDHKPILVINLFWSSADPFRRNLNAKLSRGNGSKIFTQKSIQKPLLGKVVLQAFQWFKIIGSILKIGPGFFY